MPPAFERWRAFRTWYLRRLLPVSALIAVVVAFIDPQQWYLPIVIAVGWLNSFVYVNIVLRQFTPPDHN
jgi:hypothetical protein